MSDGLELSKCRLDALLGTLEQIVLFVGAEQDVQRCTAGTAAWLNPARLEGVRLDELFSPEILKQLNGMQGRAAATGQAESAECQLRPVQLPVLKEAGLTEARWVKMTVGQVAGQVVLLLHDITEQKRLSRKVASQAQRDPLTGAYNRRALLPVLGQAMAQAQRYDWICSIIIVDVDHFKGINDEHGWDAGDQLLQQLVTSLHSLKRTADFLARFGDDELALFLPETNQEQAMLAANRLLQAARELEIPYQTGDIKFTLSIGVATLSGIDDTAVAMLKRAEENLFIAKQSGGDRAEGER